MAPAFRAITIVLAFLALAPHSAARWRFDVRHDLTPPGPTNPVFVGELTPPQPLEVVVPDSPGDATLRGAVTLSFCVTRDGKVIHVAVTRSLSSELDDLSAQAVRDRMNNAKAKAVITADGGFRRGAALALSRAEASRRPRAPRPPSRWRTASPDRPARRSRQMPSRC